MFHDKSNQNDLSGEMFTLSKDNYDMENNKAGAINIEVRRTQIGDSKYVDGGT